MTANHTDQRRAIRAMYGGLGLTIIATISPYVDRATGNTLAEHIRDGYPTYTQSHIDSAATIYVVYLSIVGALGVIGWAWTIWAVRSGKPWARPAATAMFTIGTAIALTDLLIKDTSGKPGLPPTLGWIGFLPCLSGLLALTLLWKRSPARRETTAGQADPSVRPL
jgi:hypothetical protein